MLAYVRKFIVAALCSGGVITEVETIDSHSAKVVAIILTAIVNALGVYAVPNGRAVPPATK